MEEINSLPSPSRALIFWSEARLAFPDGEGEGHEVAVRVDFQRAKRGFLVLLFLKALALV